MTVHDKFKFLTQREEFIEPHERHMFTGRLNDAPENGERVQVAEIVHTEIKDDGRTLAVALPARTVSIIEMPWK